jgi:hypothetical protein
MFSITLYQVESAGASVAMSIFWAGATTGRPHKIAAETIRFSI